MALASIGAGLRLAPGVGAWVLAGFALAMAVGMPLFGRVSVRYGLQSVVRISLVLFTVGGVLAGVANGLALLIAGRMLQGAGTSAAFVSTYGTINVALPSEQRPRALASVAAAVSVASGCGPLLGGTIDAFLGWRAVVALPVLAAFAAWPVQAAAPAGRSQGPFDARGAALVSVIGITLLLLIQSRATALGPSVVLATATVLAVCAIALVAHVKQRPDGFVPRDVIRAPGFVSTSSLAFTAFAAYFTLLFATPTLLRAVHGWNGPVVGLAMAPAAVVGAFVTRSFVARHPSSGPSRHAVLALPLAGITGLLLAAAAFHHPAALVVALGSAMVGFTGTQVVLVAVVGTLVPAGDRPVAIGLFNFAALAGGAIGPALAGALLAAVGPSATFALLAVLPALAAVLWRARGTV
ncbi:MFS transporter [Pendulispora albinea]|uniref:Tetracycline resistance protein n=1 Tax=Pendulispora albinea TaxID=2741071 RepID=A0ABZ2LM38_9BACT